MSILFDRAKSWLQYPLPHHFLSRFVHFITRLQAGLLSQIAIRLFVKIFKVKLEESERKHPTDYESFNDFFTRSLSPGARPVDASRGSVASPVDGTISQVGAIKDGQVLYFLSSRSFESPKIPEAHFSMTERPSLVPPLPWIPAPAGHLDPFGIALQWSYHCGCG